MGDFLGELPDYTEPGTLMGDERFFACCFVENLDEVQEVGPVWVVILAEALSAVKGRRPISLRRVDLESVIASA